MRNLTALRARLANCTLLFAALAIAPNIYAQGVLSSPAAIAQNALGTAAESVGIRRCLPALQRLSSLGINNAENAVLRINPNVNLGANYDADKVQFGVRTYTTYNTAQNTLQHAADQKYFVFNNNFTISVKPVKTFRLFSELNQNIFTAQPNNPGQSVYLLNAGADQYFMKNQLTLTLSGFDLLKQNAGLQRQITQTGQITSTQTNTLGQYFYVKLTYKLSKVGTSKASAGSPIIIMR